MELVWTTRRREFGTPLAVEKVIATRIADLVPKKRFMAFDVTRRTISPEMLALATVGRTIVTRLHASFAKGTITGLPFKHA